MGGKKKLFQTNYIWQNNRLVEVVENAYYGTTEPLVLNYTIADSELLFAENCTGFHWRAY